MRIPIKPSILVVILLSIASNGLFAETHHGVDGPADTPAQPPYVSINVGIEVSGLEQAAEDVAAGLNLIGASLRELGDTREFSPEQRQQISQTLSHVDELGQSLSIVLEKLPDTVTKGLEPVTRTSDELSARIKRIVIITAVSLVLIILAALAAVYYFVLAPGTRAVIETTALLNDLADTLKQTADIVETSSARNIQTMKELQKLQHKLT